ncbi:pSer/pThr/pTyr-binding forkhead associated (FHA) protein [Branchiibius hedensis]|uniref:Forkhead associated (FHA) domain, binds pSer, pThr, pTyr n=1 Tax=Branchiibius hedensis TaxID=672460 RepID=A0A2Y8ZPV1_9MICO|nr:FHA domain-containing protein [Branchiibius hedensis]PWJ25049.1 pSer/pThr/pTyr-binding forkhead associated (FHA) protein [Branchiibius hedensis]SSA33864.1 Forkhead associated (FHA) domain, binds pSer, pThr, pTyr [Branchiibius hedensis]
MMGEGDAAESAEQPPPADATAFFEPGSGQPVPEGAGPTALAAADRATVDALRPGTALLIAQRGPNTGARFLLDADEVSVGRHPSSDIFLDDVTVSRRHAVFRRTDSGFAVQDVGSLNGTYLNGGLIDSTVLRTGDEVQIGKFRLVFYDAPPSS